MLAPQPRHTCRDSQRWLRTGMLSTARIALPSWRTPDGLDSMEPRRGGGKLRLRGQHRQDVWVSAGANHLALVAASTWSFLARLDWPAALVMATALGAAMLKGAPEVRLYRDRREIRRSQARLVSASVERTKWRPTTTSELEPLMAVVVRNDGDSSISHVEVDVPGWGWCAIPFLLVATKPTVAGHASVSQGLGREPATWMPTTCSVRFIDHEGRGWTRDATGRLRRYWRITRWLRQQWSQLVLRTQNPEEKDDR